MLGTGAGCGGGQSRATPVPDILLCTAGTCQNRNMSGCLQVKPRACACLSQTLHVFAPSSSIHDHIHIFQCMQACCTPTFYAALQKYEDWHCWLHVQGRDDVPSCCALRCCAWKTLGCEKKKALAESCKYPTSHSQGCLAKKPLAAYSLIKRQLLYICLYAQKTARRSKMHFVLQKMKTLHFVFCPGRCSSCLCLCPEMVKA